MYRHVITPYTVEVFDDSEHRFGSDSNKEFYSKYYFGETQLKIPTSRHGVKVIKDGTTKENCLLIGFANTSIINEHSSIIVKQNIIVSCCDTIFCLSVPDLSLVWKQKIKTNSYLKLFNFGKDIICLSNDHLIRMYANGNIVWSTPLSQYAEQTSDMNIFIDDKQIFIKKHNTISEIIDLRGNSISQ